MSLKKRVVKVDKVIDRFCDMCELRIQNGEEQTIDGFPIFTGVHVEMLKSRLSAVEVDSKDVSGFSWEHGIIVRFKTNWSSQRYFELCQDCSKKVVEFIVSHQYGKES